MPKRLHLPQRPAYQQERRIVGIPVLISFSLLLLCRLLGDRLPFSLPPFMLTLIFEILVFLLPAFIFILTRPKGYGQHLRFKMPRSGHVLLLLSAFFALFTGCLLLSILCGGIDTLGNSVTTFEGTSAPTPWYGVMMVAVLALLPAFAEEILFRGIVLAEYERRGVLRGVLLSTLLFALIHFDFGNLPVYLFSGLLLALVLYATESLIATVLLHGCYNLLSLFGNRYLNALYDFTGHPELFIFFLIFVFFLALLIFCNRCAKVYRSRAKREVPEPKRNVPLTVQLFTTVDALKDPLLLVSLAVAITGCILFYA